jgi:hypothetical protein
MSHVPRIPKNTLPRLARNFNPSHDKRKEAKRSTRTSWSEFFDVGYAEWLKLRRGLTKIGYEKDEEGIAIDVFEGPRPN